MTRPRDATVYKKGFTLIELLVVLAIVSLLMSAVLASLSTARARSRDLRRLQELRSMQKAMEIFYASNNRYPDVSTAACGWDIGNTGNPADPFIQELETSGLFSQTPRERSLFTTTAPCYGYTYIYRKGTMAGCNNDRLMAILAVFFERPHAQLGLPVDEIEPCACPTTGLAGDTCTNANRYGILFKE